MTHRCSTLRPASHSSLLIAIFAWLVAWAPATLSQEIFSDGFESGDICQWSGASGVAEWSSLAIHSLTPSDGSVGSHIVIEGAGFGTVEPQVFLTESIALEVLEHQHDRILARLASAELPGTYDVALRRGLCFGERAVAAALDSFTIRLPAGLGFAPDFAELGNPVTMTGSFFGSQPGQVAIQSQRDPASGFHPAAVSSWTADPDTSDGSATFTIPAGLTENGLYDVRVTNGIGSVTVPGGLVIMGLDDGDDEALHLVSAVATSNTEVLLQFSEPVQGGSGGAENPNHYQIDGPPLGDTPTVGVLAAEVQRPSLSTVRLTTMSQSDIPYTLTVVNVRDLAGNSIIPPTVGNPHPNQLTFIGKAPTGLIDSDGDGLSDADEQLGWIITVTQADGAEETRHVTSDPGDPRYPLDDPINVAARDTDADGVPDAEERHAGLNPRSADTDGDTLDDDLEWNHVFSDGSHQDTDGDGLQDGVEHSVLRTSPLLFDTDGDQISDPEEVSAGNRNPLLSDLPAPRIRIGSVNLQLDTRFTFTNEEGEVVTEQSTSESTLTRGSDETFSTSNESATKSTLETSQQLQVSAKITGAPKFGGGSVTATAGSTQGSERGSTFTVGEESRQSSEESYHESLTTSTARDIRQSVTREIVDATVKVDVSIDSLSDIPFTISNLELTAQTQDPDNRRNVIPVASMVPENPDFDEVNIGALGDPSRGPFVFKTVSVFPQQVQELLKNPSGFVVQLANFDITDESGRNFAYISQDVLDRTAGITFDLGDGRVENYRVATASLHDPATGVPVGITMEYALNHIIGLHNRATVRDGGNGVVETVAAGDDVQTVALGELVEPSTVFITAGPNGVLDTATFGGDDAERPADYETTLLVRFASIRDGGNGIVETEASEYDEQLAALGSVVGAGQTIVGPGADEMLNTTETGGDDVLVPAPPPHLVLSRFRDVANETESKRFWVLYTPTELPAVDLDQIVMRSGETYNFTYVQDKDEDGVWAREEFLHGSSDLLPNTDRCVPTIRDGSNGTADTAAVGDDEQVVAVGDEVAFGGVVVAPGPNGVLDTEPTEDDVEDDGQPCDTLTDQEEIQQGWRVQLKSSPEGFMVYPNPNQGDSDRDQLPDDVEKSCLFDPRQRDTDLDGLTDWEELRGMLLENGDAEGRMVSRDPDTDVIVVTVLPYAGMSDNPDLVPHDVTDSDCSDEGFATDPLNPDTDGDGVSDFLELRLGLDPNNPDDGALFLDDDGDGVPNLLEQDGFSTTVNGVEVGPFTSNPNNPDTDDDGLPDLLEHFLGSNPSEADTDGDGITDPNEYKNGGEACVTVTPGAICESFGSLAEGNFARFVAQCASADLCNNATIEADLIASGSLQHGTNLNERDSDFDAVDDPDELAGRSITVNGATVELAAPVSDPLDPTTDEDGWDDGEERDAGTDPGAADTDEDDLQDDLEPTRDRDPTFRDKRVRVTSAGHNITHCGDGAGECEIRWEAAVSIDGGSFNEVCTLEADRDVGFETNFCEYFSSTGVVIRDEGSSTRRIRMTGREDDDLDDDICDTKTETFDYASSVNGSRDVTQDCDGDLELTTTLDVVVD